MDRGEIMDKNELCKIVNNKLKDIRFENGFSQEVMADVIGVSKKTYIQLEKERVLIGWAQAVTVCTLFQDTKTITEVFGEDVLEIVQVVALEKVQKRQLPTFGGTIWWKSIKKEKGLRLQQHKLSYHYRILDQDNYRLYFTLSKKDAIERFNRYLGK